MNLKKLIPLHSQISGIIWITIVLITILAIIFFSREREPETAAADSTRVSEMEKLEKLESKKWRVVSEGRPSGYSAPTRGRARSGERNVTNGGERWAEMEPAPRRTPLVVELNSADSLTLQLLHGIGPVFARRIVKYRERLGGYTDLSQLLEVYGFTPELLAHIAPHLRIDSTAIRRIPVNSVTLKELIRHPYVEYYFARDLVKLRSKGETFSSAEDLQTIPGTSDTMLARLLPYLDFGN